jgi:hypothetical protein
LVYVIVVVDVPLIDSVPYGMAKFRHNDLDGPQVTKRVVIGTQTEDVSKHVGSVVRRPKRLDVVPFGV